MNPTLMLCEDADIDALWDGIESLAGYDAVNGLFTTRRQATADVMARLATIFRETMGGAAERKGWFLPDGAPDLNRVVNPDQLRMAAAHRTLMIALNRHAGPTGITMYERLRDYHAAEYGRAMAFVVLRGSLLAKGDKP